MPAVELQDAWEATLRKHLRACREAAAECPGMLPADVEASADYETSAQRTEGGSGQIGIAAIPAMPGLSVSAEYHKERTVSTRGNLHLSARFVHERTLYTPPALPPAANPEGGGDPPAALPETPPAEGGNG